MKKLLLLILVLTSVQAFAQKLRVEKPRTDYKENPMGVDNPRPRLSWLVAADTVTKDVLQKAYQIQVVTEKPDFKNSTNLVWDSKKVTSDQSLHITYNGKPVAPKTRYYWRVKIWDNHRRESDWSPTSYWETGLTDTTLWQASWIIPDLEEKEKVENPLPMLRKEFQVTSGIKKARLYISSHGIYHVTINGKSITDHLFAPGWTSYNHRLQYQVYDVTEFLKKGDNATGVMLGDGWFRGRFGFQWDWYIYGKKLALLYQLEIEYANGEKKTVVSDDTWKTNTGPILRCSIYDGELYNANLEIPKWDRPEFDDATWKSVHTEFFSLKNMVPDIGLPVKRIEEVVAKKQILTPKKELVFDFGQNLTGWVRFTLTGHKGDTITLEHAEVLDKEGNFYTANLRNAKQKVQYIFKDNKPVVFEPPFTFQGFRYIRVRDFPGTLTKENFTAVVVHSEMEPTGSFQCSDSLVNHLHRNIRWGMRGNFLDIPTDCPQRNERLGWTGDAQAFASTSIYLYNTAAFYLKWLEDMKAEQKENGIVPHTIPNLIRDEGSTGWGDVCTVLPYNLYLSYGDTQMIERQYPMMKRWVDYLINLAGDDMIVNSGFHYGDWLFFIHPTDWNDKPGYTDTDLIATAFMAYSTQLLIRSATLLDNKADVEKYSKTYAAIKEVFQKEYITATGRLSSNSQTAYVLALAFDLMPESLKQRAVYYLVEDIKKRNYHLSTGFLGTPFLCHVLSENGQNDVAYKLLLQKTYPSWIYPITKGATTVWERWDGIKPDNSFQTTAMNSFNHYAYGAIGSWMYSKAAGIQTHPDNPGYKHILLKPQPDSLLTYVRASYTTLYGTVASSWKMDKNTITVSFVVPSNTTATIYLPYSGEKHEVGSGKYQYTYAIEQKAAQ